MSSPARRTILALVLLALTVRGLAAAGRTVIPRDGTVYVGLARAVASEGPAAAFDGRQHPLYPLAAGLLGGSELAATLLAILACALATPAIYLIGRRLHSHALGVIAAILYAVAPHLVRNGSAPLLEGLSVPLYLWALERGLAGLDRPLNGLWAGLLGGASYLARPEALEILVVLPAGLLLLRRWRAALLLATGFLVLGGPYAGWLTREEGHLTVSRKKPAARFLAAEEGFDSHMERKSKRTGISRPSFGGALWETVRTLGEAGSWVVLPLALVGIALLLRGTSRGPPLILLSLLSLDLFLRFRLVHLHGYLAARHMVPAVCVLLPFAGAGLALLTRKRLAAATGLLAAALLILSVLPRDREKAPLREAGRRIRSEAGAGRIVATFGSPRIPYYAEGRDLEIQAVAPDLDLPAADLERLFSRIRPASDWIALVPGRLPEGAGDRIRAVLGPPGHQIGEGKWRVLLWRRSP